ncbi:MAG TPA: alanine racemase [Alphaproteobacteria bacterium]|jgi:alanine racemase|nr:alanine racemase [Alphaproteobacteria bacterium]HRK98334.1 alanine racemase [Alphaproteobacteria bacterium]
MTQSCFSRVTIDPKKLQANYTLLQKKVGAGCSVAGVVKADGYGLGIDVVVPALEDAGCRFFYVAQLEEALIARSLTDCPVAILGGLPEGCEKIYHQHSLIPVLNTLGEIARCPVDLPAIWHVDTGMNRLGIDPQDVPELLKNHPAPLLMMTHFSSSDERDDAPSVAQVALFDSVVPPSFAHSICNSSGIFKNALWHRQQVRAGMALYGLNPTPEFFNPMSGVVQLEARILQIRAAKAGETVGYNRTYTFPADARLATIGIGYADGFLRSGSNRTALYWNGQACPVVGRVSMDLVVVDITHLQGLAPQEGHWMEVIGVHQSADQLAASWGTIGYEVLTSLGARAERVVLSVS